jgi:HNH endonuclease
MRLTCCAACGHDKPDELHHHHLVARSQGGPDTDSNLITLCVECHAKIHGTHWRNNQSRLIRDGQRRAKVRGVTLGRRTMYQKGVTAALVEHAESLRPVFSEIAFMSANKAAAELT